MVSNLLQPEEKRLRGSPYSADVRQEAIYEGGDTQALMLDRNLNFMGNKAQCLPFDIVYDILFSLPAKTLIRFRCVCKSWNSLISSPTFQNQRPRLLKISNNFDYPSRINTLSFSTHNDTGATFLNEFSISIPRFLKAEFLETESHNRSPRFYPIQSCQGLVCLLSETTTDSHPNPPYIVICNPSTEEAIILPPSPRKVYDCVIGLGYASSSKEFKVVKFCRSTDFSELTEIFILGTNNAWREGNPPPPHYCYDSGSGAPFLHGALHLLPRYYEDTEDEDYYEDTVEEGYYEDTIEEGDYYITAFDIEREEYREVRLPECYTDKLQDFKLRCLLLTELGGSLCLNFYYHKSDKGLEIWLLKDYTHGQWVKECNIDVFSSTYGALYAWPLAFMGDGTIMIQVCNLAPHQKIYKLLHYDARERCFIRDNELLLSVIFYVENFMAIGSRSKECPQ